MKKKHIKNLFLILVISVAITFAFDILTGGDDSNTIDILLNVAYGFLIGGSISLSGYLPTLIVKKFDAQHNPIKVYVILLIMVFVFITIDVFAINTLWYRFVYGVPFAKMYSGNGIYIMSIITIFIGLTIFFIILSRVYMNKFIDSEKEKQKAIHEAETARYETLKSQINPHFLFNSLNTLSTLIHVDTTKADNFTTQLSSIYRYVLETQDQDLVTVSQELDFIRKYMSLQSIRFSNNFTLEIEDYPQSDKAMIIPLSLQVLLENVFKHNIISQRHKMEICLKFPNDYIELTNIKNPGKEVKVSHAVGLSNIFNRYEMLSDIPCIVEDTNTHFIVKLPLIFTD